MTLKFIDFSILLTSLNNHFIGRLKTNLLHTVTSLVKLVGCIELVLKKYGQRMKLRQLTDQQLKDIGMSRKEAEKEASKIF